MDTENLQGNETPNEVVEPTPNVEEKTPTQEEKKTTVGKTYTEKEFRKELDKAVGKGLSTLQQQLSLVKGELSEKHTLLSEKDVAIANLTDDLRDEQEAHKKLVSKIEDPESLEGYKDRRKLEQLEKDLRRKEANIIKVETAHRLSSKYDIPYGELMSCATPSDMYDKAMELIVNKAKITEPELPKEPEEPAPEPETPPQTFDAGVSSAGSQKLSLDAQRNMDDKSWFAAKQAGKIP